MIPPETEWDLQIIRKVNRQRIMQGKGLRTRYIISFIGILAVLIALVSNFFLRSKKTTITNLSTNKHQVMKKLFLCSSFADVAGFTMQIIL